MKMEPSSSPESQLLMAEIEVLPESICRMCLNLGNEVWDFDYRERHSLGDYEPQDMPVWEVAIAAQKGCPGCEVISWTLEPYMKRLREEVIQFEVHLGGTKVLKYFSDKYFDGEGFVDFIPDRIRVGLRATPLDPAEINAPHSDVPSCPWRFIRSTPAITCHTGSSVALAKVQNWYTECVGSHVLCRSNVSKPPSISNPRSQLPTRVIQIQGLKQARLYTSGDENAEYACLSHCWGGHSVIQTTTQTFEQFTSAIPWEELPKTFQDAIAFAHGIGFRYLWIDSLCIIQDSIDDWRHEGSRMSSIYADASITLSATRAANPHQGCFTRLDERFMSRTKEFTNSDPMTYEVRCHEQLPKLETPLAERGWVLQERMLSRRIVHFMEQELWWECRERSRCECGYHEPINQRSSPIGSKLLFAYQLRAPYSLAHLEWLWEKLVSAYSSKSLTYRSDVFPAIQAMAKLVPSNMGRYLAGHWESILIPSLCWSAYPWASDKHRKWHAPSWSWAAAQREVYWHSKQGSKLKTSATLLNALTVPEGDDPTGQLSSASITLRGEVLAGEIQTTGNPSGLSLILEGQRVDAIFGWRVHWDTICHDQVGKRVFALKLFELDVDSRYQRWLVLQAAEGKQDEYVRIGLLCMDNSPPERHNYMYWSNIDAKKGATDVKRYKYTYSRALEAMDTKKVETDVKII